MPAYTIFQATDLNTIRHIKLSISDVIKNMNDMKTNVMLFINQISVFVCTFYYQLTFIYYDFLAIFMLNEITLSSITGFQCRPNKAVITLLYHQLASRCQ